MTGVFAGCRLCVLDVFSYVFSKAAWRVVTFVGRVVDYRNMELPARSSNGLQ